MHSLWKLVLLISVIKNMCWCMDARGPKIVENLQDQADFSNDTGITIDCRSEGNPFPSIKWIRADGSIVNNIPGLRKIYPNGSLHFMPFSAKDYRQDIHASVYKCMAVNPLGTVISNDVRIRAGRYSIHPDGVLHIRDVRRDGNTFRYRCRTQHRLTGETKRSASAGKVIVTEPSGSVAPLIVHSRPIIEAWQGQKIRLPCIGQGLPIPHYRWEKLQDGRSMTIKLGERIHLVDGTLVLRNAQIEDSGSYVCNANNSVGIAKAETVLTIIAPLSAYIQPERQEVDEGKTATFVCTTSGHPVTYLSWIKDGRFLAMDDRVKLLSREILRIESVRREDRGMYQCIARNDRFSVQASAELKLGDAAPVFLHTFQEKTINSGDALSLKCAASGNPPLVAKWTLDDSEIMSADFVNVRNDVVSYVNISKAVTEDGGEYQCIMSNVVGTIKHSAKINVRGPPVVRVMPNVSAIAGKDAVLRCKTAGYPIQSIHWEKDNHALPTNHRHKVFQNGTLIIQQVNRVTDAGYYSCIVTNPQGQSAQRPIHLSVLNAPVINPFFFPTNSRVGVRAGIQCLITEGDLPISITWLKDDRPIPADMGISTRTLDELTRSLIINSITPWHNGNYTCVAKNSADSVKHTATLFVNVPPRWLLEPRNSSVILHRAHHLDCQAEGSPTPTITWKKAIGRTPRDYKLVSQISSNIQEARNGSLIFKESQESNEGYYLCQVGNDVGPELSKVVYLDVQVPVYFEEKYSNQSVVKGKDAVLSCTAKGDDPITIQWKTTDKLIPPNGGQRFTIKERPNLNGLTSELIISRIERRDSNVYHCEASNPYGTDHTKIDLMVKESPEAPKSLTIISKSSRNVHLSWTKPFNGNSTILKYIVQYRAESENWDKARNATLEGTDPSAILKGLRPSTRYPIRIFAENEIGIGPPSGIITITTDDDAPEGPPLDIRVTALDSRTLKVEWKPPKLELWNGAIQGYHIGYREYEMPSMYEFKTHTLRGTASENQLEYRIIDLKKFTKYAIVVEAYNALGVGPRSPEILVSTLEDVPSKPPNSVKCVTLSSHSIRVQWAPPPPYSQHGILQGYKISYKTTNKLKDVKGTQITTLESIVLENLKEFTNYSVEVLAFNRAGDGRSSEPVHCHTDEDVPGPPAEIKALVMSSDAVLLSWKPPNNPNGIIIKYTVYMRANGHLNTKPMSHTVPPTQLYYEARGLEEELHYEFWTTASTSIGEGKETQVISQSPTSIVPARIASFPEKITINKKEDVKLQCRAVGIPTPDREWRLRGERLEEKARLRILSDGSLFLTNARIHDSGNYSCRVINIYATQEIQYELIVKGQGKDASPPTPVLEKKLLTKSSITLHWTVDDEGRNPIHGYTLNYRENSGEWKELNIEADNESFTFENLKCGTRYQFYITASNRMGTSEPSDMLDLITLGQTPKKPSRDAFIRVNTTSIGLNFSTWSDGGCPTTDFIIEYKMKDENEWQKMVHNPGGSQQHVAILGLKPDSIYTVRIRAGNEAGYTTADYDIATLLDGAGQDLSEYSKDRSAPDLLNYLDLNIIIPVATIAGIIIFAVAVLCTVFQCRRYIQQKTGGSARHIMMRALASGRGSRRREVELPSPVSSKQQDLGKSQQTNATCYRESVHDDICPYATYQLPTGTASNDPASMQLKTFSHVKSAEENWPPPKLQTVKLIHSKKEQPNSVNVSLQETALVHRKTQGSNTPSQPSFDDSSGQLSWFPDSVDRKEILQIHPFCQTSLIPSAPPAEGNSSSLSESENTIIGEGQNISTSKTNDGYRHNHTSKTKPLHRVPDLLYNRPDSSSSNEYSSDREKCSLNQEDVERYSRKRYSRTTTLRQQSSETSPEDAGQQYSCNEPLNAPPGFADKSDMLGSEGARKDSKLTKNDNDKSGRHKTSRNLDAEEEELIALLKRGQVPGEHQSNPKDDRGGLYNTQK